MKKGSKYLTLTQRRQLEGFLQADLPKRKIAEILGVNLSTVYREIKRGVCEQRKKVYDVYGDLVGYKAYTIYSADIAENKYRLNMTAKGAPLKIGNDFDFIRYVEKRILVDGIAPCAVVGEIKRNKPCKTVISKTTMYRYIEMGMFLNVSMRECPMGQRKKKRRKATVKRPPKGTSIEKRPLEIFARDTFGHWEQDSVIGKSKGTNESLLVLTERKTRYEIILRTNGKTRAATVQALNNLIPMLPPGTFQTITVDNGSEFQDCKGMEYDQNNNKRLTVYYCHPYCSCERGSNERNNRIIRRYLPKGKSLRHVTQQDCDRIAAAINDMPRKILGYATARELFEQELSALTAAQSTLSPNPS